MGIAGRIIGRRHIRKAVIGRMEPLEVSHRRGIIDAQNGSGAVQPGDHPEAGRAPDVVGIGLERHTQYADDLLRQHPQRALDLPQQPVDAGDVDALHLFQHADVDAAAPGYPDQGADVLGQAGTAEAQARVEKVAADARVEANTLGHGGDVYIEFLAEVRHQVDEGDLRGEKGVGRLLDQFGRRHARDDDRAVEAGLVEVEEQRPGPLAVRADDDPVRMQKVADGGTLPQKLRIAGDVKLPFPSGQPADRPVDPVCRAGGNGALLHDQLVAIQHRRDGAGDFLDLGQVGVPIASGRGSHADEDHVGCAHGILGFRGEAEAVGLQVGGQQLLQPGFMNGRHAIRQACNDVWILVDGRDGVPQLREAHRRDQSRVSCAEEAKSHTTPHLYPWKRWSPVGKSPVDFG